MFGLKIGVIPRLEGCFGEVLGVLVHGGGLPHRKCRDV